MVFSSLLRLDTGLPQNTNRLPRPTKPFNGLLRQQFVAVMCFQSILRPIESTNMATLHILNLGGFSRINLKSNKILALDDQNCNAFRKILSSVSHYLRLCLFQLLHTNIRHFDRHSIQFIVVVNNAYCKTLVSGNV